MKKIIAALAIAACIAAPKASAEVFDLGIPENPFSFGFRIGINQSNISNNFEESLPDIRWTSTSWGSGFTTGIVADMNLRNFLSLEPGIFFQSRTQSYNNTMFNLTGPLELPETEMVDGHVRYYNFNLPIMIVLHLNLLDNLGTRVEFGPYFQGGFGGRNKYTAYYLDTDRRNRINRYALTNRDDVFGKDGMNRAFDWGFKFGVGFTFENYYLGIHYEAGVHNVYKQFPGTRRDLQGYNKAWDFTVGYYLF